MRPGYALFTRRLVPFSVRLAAEAASVIQLVSRSKLAVAAVISVSFVLAAQAQEQVSAEDVALPPWSEPTLPSAEPASSSPVVEPSVPAPAALPSVPEPQLPSSESVPSSDQAFPTTPDPWASTTGYTTAQTSVVAGPAAGGPYGGFNTKNIAVGEGPASSEPRRFFYGLQFTVRGVWDDNIFISHTNKVSDYYFALEPQLTLGIGDVAGRSRSYLRLDYMPSGILFVDHPDEDAFNQLIHLEGGYDFGRLRLSLFEDIALLQSANLNSIIDTTGLWANLDASAPTRLNIFNTRLRADYDLTGKLFLQGELDSYIYFYPNNISDYTVAGGLYLYYNWTPKLSVGVGGTFGYNWVDNPTTNQTFEQVNARFNYQATAKLGVYASAGVEFRQFEGNRSTYTTPVFEVGVEHHPFEGTQISLAAGRRMYNSGYFANQDFANTYVVGRFQQRLFRRLYLGLGAGYENSNYFATTNNVSAPREDDYWFIEPSLDVLVTRWLSTGVYYLHREDTSNLSFFSFDDNQVGVRATVRF